MSVGLPFPVPRACHRTAEFNFDWSVKDITNITADRQTFISMTDSFTFNVSPEFVFTNICTDRFSFWISPGVSFAKSYTISSSSGLCPSSGPLVNMEAFGSRGGTSQSILTFQKNTH
jgi:hypothetical protein